MPSALVRSIARGIGGAVSRTTDSTGDALSWGGDYGWSVPTAAGVAVNQASAMQVSAVFACVTILSYDLAKLGASIYNGKKRGARTKAKAHPIYPFFTSPAPWLTWFEFCGMLQMSLLLRGNGYAVILRDLRGAPKMLVPINPDRVALWEAPDGELFYMVTRAGLHQMAVLAKMPFLIHADDIFHLKALTANGLLGLSPISLEREAIGLAIAQEQLAARWAGNSAQPRGILTTDQRLTQESADRMHDEWKRLHGGLYNAGKTAVFEAGLTWQPLAMTSHDMEFLAARQFQLAEIARIFRVPLYMLGEEGKSSRGTAITQQAQEYLNYTLSTYIKMWETRIEFTFGLDPDGTFVEFDVDELVRGDIQIRYAANRIALGGAPWMKPNEVRANEGMDDVEGGDTLWRPANTVPAESDVFAGMADPNDPTVPDDTNPGTAGPGSDQTGTKGEGGGRPPKKGISKKPV